MNFYQIEITPMLLILPQIFALGFELSEKLPKIEILEDMIENQIFQGTFRPVGTKNCSYSISVTCPKDEKVFFYGREIPADEDTVVTFSTASYEKIKITMLLNMPEGLEIFMPGVLHFTYTTQFDTFDKNVARDVSVGPAINTLQNFEKLLYSLEQQTQAKQEQMDYLRNKHDAISILVVGCSLSTLLIFTLLNVQQVYSLSSFIKKKKLI